MFFLQRKNFNAFWRSRAFRKE